ncbi:magnesium transport protein CorA [Virgisporangium aliadipatigenens]|uniref:Magnesium transport protein CorA n=1 Tax=Virgisporangium aliadipatigenens TaxID=741659 RepID=A0A8J3YP42_9ACTN|nr:magnesium and cobalt transport protein CorA [Virgisporangium aliadipatigenens]GIJ49124.1 magnesium transport protein CorA [Virgisporangium aliadipatigenens]
MDVRKATVSLLRRKPHPTEEPVVEPTPEKTPRAIDEVIGDCAVYEQGRRKPGKIPFDELGRAVSGTDGFVWIGLQRPTAEEIAVVAAELSLPELAVEDAVQAHQRPKLETYDGMVFAVLKPVRYIDREEVLEVEEIAIFLGPKFVVTVRHGESKVLGRVRHELEDPSSYLHRFGPAGVLYRAADLIVDGYEEAITCVNTDVDEIEEQVFGDDDTDHARRIYKLKREVAGFRRAVLPLGAPLQRLAEGTVAGVDPATSPYFRDVHDHLLRAGEAIEGHDRLLSDVLQADLSRVGVRQSEIAVEQNEVAARQNEDMRKISAWAAMGLVPTAIAGIYGMNFDHMPELHWRYGYFLILGVMATACTGLYVMFKRNGWL